MKPFVLVPDWLSGLMTWTFTAPAEPAGEVQVIEVELVRLTFVALLLPNFTVALAWKSAPVIATLVPPAVVPQSGLTAVTVGGGTVVMRIPLRQKRFDD